MDPVASRDKKLSQKFNADLWPGSLPNRSYYAHLPLTTVVPGAPVSEPYKVTF